MNRAILNSLIAQFFGLFLNIIIQVLAIPLLIKYWGIGYYGEWLIIFSIPSFLGMSDLGLGTAASTEISLLIGKNNFKKADELLNSVFYFIQIIGILMLIIFLISLYSFSLYNLLSLRIIPERDFNICFILLCLYMFLSLVTTLPQGLYRTIGEFSRGQYISNIFRAGEFLLFFVVVVLGGKCVLAACAFLSIRLLYGSIIIFDIWKKANWITISIPHINFNIVKPVLKPSLSLMGITAGQAILGQGLISVIGARSTSSDVVTFSAARTLVNFTKQIIGFLNLSYWGELTKAFASNNSKQFIKLISRVNQMNFLLTTVGSFAMFFLGPFIIQIWTCGAISIDTVFFNWLVIFVFFDNIWSSNWTLLMSINKHLMTLFPYLVSSIIALSIIYIYLPIIGITIIPYSLIMMNIIMIIVVFRITSNILSISSFELLKTFFQIK